MAKTPKTNEIMTGVWAVAIGLVSLVFTLGLAMVPPKGGAAYSALLGSYHLNSVTPDSFLSNLLLWICLPLIPIISLEGGLWRFRQALAIDESKLEYKSDSIWSKIGALYQYIDIMSTLFYGLIILAILAACTYEVSNWPRQMSLNPVLYLLTAVAYFALRGKLAGLLGSFNKAMSKGSPTHQLTDDGVTIKLVTMWNKKNPGPPPVHIRFDEIQEFQTMTYSEADAFLKYKVGPDMGLIARQTQDYARYVRGEIPRPSVYTFGAVSSASKTVFIKGQDFFYLLNFGAADPTHLENAYNAFKASRGI
ncbi:MAG: hypothetical protein ACM3UZ_16375 [Acidobacteriota bacterium]